MNKKLMLQGLIIAASFGSVFVKAEEVEATIKKENVEEVKSVEEEAFLEGGAAIADSVQEEAIEETQEAATEASAEVEQEELLTEEDDNFQAAAETVAETETAAEKEHSFSIGAVKRKLCVARNNFCFVKSWSKKQCVSALVFTLDKIGSEDRFDIVTQGRLFALLDAVVDRLHFLVTGKARTFKFAYKLAKKGLGEIAEDISGVLQKVKTGDLSVEDIEELLALAKDEDKAKKLEIIRALAEDRKKRQEKIEGKIKQNEELLCDLEEKQDKDSKFYRVDKKIVGYYNNYRISSVAKRGKLLVQKMGKKPVKSLKEPVFKPVQEVKRGFIPETVLDSVI